jgi:alkylation response protein AidB-like acyl-CoA dehydrogenase
MNFELSKEHRMAQQLFRSFAEKEVRPLAQEVDENERFPSETVEKMARYGFLGIPCSREWGGQGCDTLTYVLCVEELSRACATTGVIVSAHTSLACDPIEKYGTAEQKRKYLPDLLSGRKLGPSPSPNRVPARRLGAADPGRPEGDNTASTAARSSSPTPGRLISISSSP